MVELSVGLAVGFCVVFAVVTFIALKWYQKYRADEYMNLIIVNHKDIVDDPKAKPPPFFSTNKVGTGMHNISIYWAYYKTVWMVKIRPVCKYQCLSWFLFSHIIDRSHCFSYCDSVNNTLS